MYDPFTDGKAKIGHRNRYNNHEYYNDYAVSVNVLHRNSADKIVVPLTDFHIVI